jgi:hypothetical protein
MQTEPAWHHLRTVPRARPIRPLRPSFASLLLGLETRGVVVSTATGFVVRRGDRAYLVSNGHVFSGRDPISKTSTHCPDTVRFKYWRVGAAPSLEEHTEPLQHDAQPLWLEHPSLGARADVAALPLTNFAVEQVATHDPWLPRYVEVGIGDDVTVVGFPFAVNVNHLAIWTRASIASEHEADYSDLPVFLVDARTRDGQSGSPVLFFRTGSYLTRDGALTMVSIKTPRAPGKPIPEDEPPSEVQATEQFLGIYSGRIDERSDLGFVWRPSVIREIVEGGHVATW